MKSFAALLDRLVYTPSRNGKLRLLADYFRRTPDPDRGWALAALTGTLDFPNAKAGAIRDLAREQTDEVLFALSYDYVGDLAETTALLWQTQSDAAPPGLADVVETLRCAGRTGVRGLVSGWLDGLDATGRWALLKLITGGLRIGVSARLARVALAQAFDTAVGEIEEVWHAVEPPYADLFAWLAGGADRPDLTGRPVFRPFMLAHPLEERADLDPADWFVEWKWDGIRVQLAARGGDRRLYSRTGDDISAAFPDVLAAMAFDGVLDGELLVRDAADPGSADPASFNALQQRLNRKTVSKKMLAAHPAYVIAYDILFDGASDLRGLSLEERRPRLETFVARHDHPDIELSALLDAPDWSRIAALQAEARRLGREGLMLKRRDSRYEAGPQDRPVVQVEARSATGRRRAHVRPARPRQAQLLLFRLYLRRLAGWRTRAGRQGLFRLYRRGAGPARQMGAQQHGEPLRPGARGREAAGLRGRLRQHPRQPAPQIRPRHALPPYRPHPLGQAGRRGRPDRRA